jgi:hypothetical protein
MNVPFEVIFPSANSVFILLATSGAKALTVAKAANINV